MTTAVALPQSGIVDEDYLATLFDSLTLEHLRLVLANLFVDEDEVPSVRSRHEAIQQIRASATSAKVVEVALGVEARSAMKHCFVGWLRTPENVDTLGAAPQWSDFSFKGVDARVARVERSPCALQVTLEHFITTKEWKQVDDVTKVIEERLVRHSLIVQLDQKSAVATVRYAGYSQGSASKPTERVSYEALVLGLLHTLREKFQISISALPVHGAIQALQLSDSSRLRIVSADVEARYGKLSLSTADDSNSVQTLLADLLSSHTSLKKGDLEDIAQSILRESSANVILVLWSPEQIFTRIRFWDIGAELLFIWNGATPSIELSDPIVKLIADLARSSHREGGRDAWTLIAEAKPGTVLTPRAISERSRSSADDAGKILVEAARAALVEPVFRLKTSHVLEGLGQRWTRDLTSLTRSHKGNLGEVIEGADPSNIEVGFRRIGKELPSGV